MSSSAHIDNKKKGMLVLEKGPTQGLEHILTAEKMYSINFTATFTVNKNFCLSLHYNGTNSYLFVNGKEIYKKMKDKKIKKKKIIRKRLDLMFMSMILV